MVAGAGEGTAFPEAVSTDGYSCTGNLCLSNDAAVLHCNKVFK